MFVSVQSVLRSCSVCARLAGDVRRQCCRRLCAGNLSVGGLMRSESSLVIAGDVSVRQLETPVSMQPSEDFEVQVQRLNELSRQEVLVLLDTVSRAGIKDKHVWRSYAGQALGHVATANLEELCAMVRALCRADFPKRSLLNAVCRRIRTDSDRLPPRLLAQLLSDLRRLKHLDGPLLLSLLGQVSGKLKDFRSFDLPLVLCAFAHASLRNERWIEDVGQELHARRAELIPSEVATAFYSLALLDYGGEGSVTQLLAAIIPRVIVDASCQELVNFAFALVMLDLPAAETLSFVLERLARRSATLDPRQVHALRIVEHCVLLPQALRPALRASLVDNPESAKRSALAVQKIVATVPRPTATAKCLVRTSKLQQRLGHFFDKLSVPHLSEEAVGPYLLDFTLPLNIAVEVDGYTHFYAFSRRPTARSKLKFRVLKALGWRVVSLPHFEWLPRTEDKRLAFLASRIEAAAGVSLSMVRRSSEATNQQPAGMRTRRVTPAHLLPHLPPARGAFPASVRR